MSKLKNSMVALLACLVALSCPALCPAEGRAETNGTEKVVDLLEELDRLKRDNALLRMQTANKELERKLAEPALADPRSILPPSFAHLQGAQMPEATGQDGFKPGVRVMSIQGFDGRMTATLSLGNGQYVTVTSGDELADKSRVVSITPSAVHVSQGGRKVRLPFAEATSNGGAR